MACGTHTIIDAVLGTDRIGETTYAHHLIGALGQDGGRGMIVLADRNFAGRARRSAYASSNAVGFQKSAWRL